MGTISRITTFSTGDTLTASDLNGEFDNIISTANGSINADNLGVTAGQASASKAIVLDANKDFANVTTSNQIRNLTISGSLKIGTTFLPDAAGGADLGSTSLEWGDVYVADDKYLYMGSDQNIKIGYDETTTDSLAISAIEGAALAITLRADEGDDAGDEWKLNVADGGVVTFGNDIASAGTFVTHLTLTPHATVSSSTLALAGGLTVAGTAGITGIATVGGLTIGSAAINEAELEAIDGVTAGTVAASKAVVVDSNKDIGTFRNITLNGTLSDGNYTFDTSGNVTGLGTVGSGAITSTGVVTGTGFTIGSAAINEAELETIDGVTAGTVAASKAVVVDSNKDISSFRNVTLTGELDAATGDFSGDVDVDGTLEADAITLNGTALGSLYSPIAGSTSIVTVGTIGTGTWQGTAVASAYLDADTAHLSTTQTFSGAKTFSAAAQFSNTVTVGVDDTGYDVKFFGATSGSSLLWDESADDLIFTNAGLAVGSDATGDIYYRNSSGFLARLGASTDGYVLTTGGAGTIPAWEAAPGGGSFSGPGSSTDNAVVRFNGTGGNTGQNSGVIIDDSNNITGAANVTLSGELDAATGDFSGIIDVAGAATLASLVCTAGGTFGGGYGSTGATISTAGVGQFNGALTTDGTLEANAVTIGGTALLANDTNNRVTTATGSGTLNGEANLTFSESSGDYGLAIGGGDPHTYSGADAIALIGSTSHANSDVVISTTTSGTGTLTFTDTADDADQGKIHYSHPSDIMQFFTGATVRMSIDNAGMVGINNTANASMTQGLTINQNANDNEILALKSSDIAHGMTDFAETDTYMLMKKNSGTAGAGNIVGFGEGGVGFKLTSYIGTTPDNSFGATAGAGIILRVEQKSGTGAGAVGANGNVFGIRANQGGTVRSVFLVDEDGDVGVDGSTTLAGYDDFPDWQLARAGRAILSPDLFPNAKALASAYKEELNTARIILHNEDTDGKPFLNLKRGLLFAWDGLYQVGQKIYEDVAPKVEQLESAMIARDIEIAELKKSLKLLQEAN